MSDEPKPVFGRDKLGRHKVDFSQIKSPVVRYGLAITVVACVIGAAWWVGGGSDSEDDFAWLVPWLGWAVIILVAISLLSRLFGRR